MARVEHPSVNVLVRWISGDIVPRGHEALQMAEHISFCEGCSEQVATFSALDVRLDAVAVPSRAAQPVARAVVESPVGPLLLEASERGVRRLGFQPAAVELMATDHPLLEQARQQLEEYFAGVRQDFDVPLDLEGVSPFHREVLRATVALGFGGSTTYGRLAAQLGRPRAARAVGGALNRNPLPIFVPCHRVVGSNGSLVGYAGGLRVKEFLLRHEGSLLPGSRFT